MFPSDRMAQLYTPRHRVPFSSPSTTRYGGGILAGLHAGRTQMVKTANDKVRNWEEFFTSPIVVAGVSNETDTS
jgi:hypothetical protein